MPTNVTDRHYHYTHIQTTLCCLVEQIITLFCPNYVKLTHKGPRGGWSSFINYFQITE